VKALPRRDGAWKYSAVKGRGLRGGAWLEEELTVLEEENS
jgi:hypothetical protein